MSEVKLPPTKVEPKVETPSATPAIQSEADKQKAAKMLEASKQIAVLNEAIAKAKSDAKRWSDMAASTDADDVAFSEMQIAKNPNWLADKQARVTDAEQALKDFKLSLVSPEQKKDAIALDALKVAADKATADYNAAKLAFGIKYPDTIPKHVSTPRTPKDPNAPAKAKSADVIPFTGVMLDNATVLETVRECIMSGMTSETDMVRKIYGAGFTIGGGADCTGTGNPRNQIHPMRVALAKASGVELSDLNATTLK